jgi:hypothetical protein
MPRGKAAQEGDTRVAPNGYHYTRTATEWRLTHHIVAEKYILGRPLREGERVTFRSNDKSNLDPSNIHVTIQGRGSLRRRKAQLEARIRELQAELDSVNKKLLE